MTTVHTITAPDGTVKRVIPPPRPTGGPETPRARRDRLVATARLNGVRVRKVGEHEWRVPSQQREAGKPLQFYTVVQVVDAGYYCSCFWGKGNDVFPGHGLYCPENEIALCAHIACVVVYVEREARETARMARALAQTWTRLAQGQAETMQDRRALAGARLDPDQAYADLFGQEG